MYMKEYDYLVVGAGLFAAVFVRQAIDAGKRCLVIDKRSHIGGNIYCENVMAFMYIFTERTSFIQTIKKSGIM